MPDPKDSPATTDGEAGASAPATPVGQWVATGDFTARFHTQLLSFRTGDRLDANVGEFFAERGGLVELRFFGPQD